MSEEQSITSELSNEQSETSSVETSSIELKDQQDAQNAKDVLNDPKSSAKEKEQARKTLKSLKIKYNGKEYEEQLPFEIPDDEKAVEYMRRQLQLSKMAQIKAQEKAEIEREVAAFIQQLRANPRAVLEDPALGLNMQELVAQYIEEQLENSKKSPEQIKAEQLEKELKKLQEEREREREEMRKRELERLQQQEFERYDTLITKALEKSSLPKSPYVVKKVADYMLMGLQEGYDITPEDVIPLVEEDIKNDIKQMFSVMPEEVVEKIIGNEVLGKLRKKRLSMAKTPATVKKSIVDTGKVIDKSEESNENNKKKISYKEFFKI